MNRWAARHAHRLIDALDTNETLLDAHRVVITNAFHGEQGESVRRGGRPKRVEGARSVGFPVPGPVFVLGLSEQRLLFYRGSTLLARPTELVGSIAVENIASVTTARRFRAQRLGILLEERPVLVVQPLWGGRLDELADAFAALRR